MAVHSRRATLCAAAGVALVVIGVIAVVLAVRAQRHAPQPPSSAAKPVAIGPPSARRQPIAGSPSKLTARGPILDASVPVQLAIPAIGVTSSVHPLGLNADNTVQVPPLGRDSYAGWYKYSPTPGQLGPSVILGHIDSAQYGPGVFFKLGALRQRDRVVVTRADRSVAVFEIERVVEYHKAHFPTFEVYGNTDHAALRLITCGGKFDLSAHSYEDNIVVYASLISSHRN